jgi:type IV pilus assembly protein PilE
MTNTAKIKGVTVLELLVTVLIISILAIIAVVMYSSQVRQSRRIDAINTLFAIALAEESYRTTNTTYGTLAQVWNGVSTSTGGHYTLAISTISATTYTLTATAIGNQANDVDGSTSCSTLTFTLSSGTITKTPAVCWPS